MSIEISMSTFKAQEKTVLVAGCWHEPVLKARPEHVRFECKKCGRVLVKGLLHVG